VTWGSPGVPLFALSEQVGGEPRRIDLRLAIVGSRTLSPSVRRISERIAAWLATAPPGVSGRIIEVVSGRAPGVDLAGERWARAQRLPVQPFPARWEEHGHAAPFIRNEAIARYCDAMLAFWDGESRGTRDVVRRARRLGKPVRVERC
jgi:YspA, cpYpsA-related SLOG family